VATRKDIDEDDLQQLFYMIDHAWGLSAADGFGDTVVLDG
jgi:hypothetical protein